MDVTYNQDVKKESRERLISHAIEALTSNRNESYLVSKDHFTKITDHFNTLMHQCVGPGNIDFHNTYNWLFFGGKNSWLKFYDSICIPKTATELRVLYLSGPEPLNDIEVLCNHGIRLENIWAIESNKSTYEEALESLKEAEIHIKIHRGKLEEFFELVNHEFDIIYYDACSPIISPNGSPLDVLKQVFMNKRLTSLSVLITNFAEPGENYNWGDLMGCWFGTKDTYEVPKADIELGWENFFKVGHFDQYSQHINQHQLEYYDNFLTHFIPAFAAEIIPMWQTISLGSLQNKYLLIGQELFAKLNAIRNHSVKVDKLDDWFMETPHFALAVDAYPLLNWANLIRDRLPKADIMNRFLDNKRKQVTLEDALYVGTLLKRFEESESGFKTFILDICSEQFKNLLTRLDFFDRPMRITCDIPMKNLLVDLFYGLYGYPYIAHAGKTLSIKYKAKETTMFSNVFVFDQCRYLYDYLPTPDLWESFFKNIAHQTIIRGCIDGILRNHIELNSSLFKWGFIEGAYGEFGMASLNERIDLNETMSC
jgi:hypothetical protein